MINENNLTEKVRKLTQLLQLREATVGEIQATLESLRGILNPDVADRDTGTTMSETRRQEIYDACIAHADRLLEGAELPEPEQDQGAQEGDTTPDADDKDDLSDPAPGESS